jgi:hypothetical protein
MWTAGTPMAADGRRHVVLVEIEVTDEAPPHATAQR